MSTVLAVASLDDVWSWLAAIPDPEVPAISIVDLGIVRDVRWSERRDGTLVVTITPTYSGCPATGVITESIVSALRAHGIPRVEIDTRLSPPWTTDWLTPGAKERLRRYGIAPPGVRSDDSGFGVITQISKRHPRIACPRCGSTQTECISPFGSTPCKAQYRCRDCLEPFDYFKPL